MRVLQLVGDPVGGVRKHVHALIDGMAQRGVSVAYVHSDTSVDATFRAEIAGLRERCVLVEALPIRKRPHASDFANVAAVFRWLREHRIDVVHGHGAKAGLYARMAGRAAGVRVVYTPHGGSVHAMFNPVERAGYRSVERMLRGCTDAFVFESVYSARGLLGQSPSPRVRWLVNPNGIAAQPPARAGGPHGRAPARIGVFGMLREEKGQDLAIRAIGRLARGGRGVELHLYGEGPQRAGLEALAEQLGCASMVIFHGDVDDAASLMPGMDLVVVPSRFESFGYAAVEALAQGVPTIAAEVGGLPEILGEGLAELLYPGADEQALAAKIAWFLDHRESVRAMVGAHAALLRERFSQARMVDRVVELYSSLLCR